MASWATLGVNVTTNADEEFKRCKNLNGKNEKLQNFLYLALTLSVSVDWFSYLTVLAATSYLHPKP